MTTPQRNAWPPQLQAVQPSGAAAEEIIAGKDGDGRNGGKNVTGELGLGKGEEDDGNQGPENQELGKGVAGAADLGRAFARVTEAPFGDGGLDAVPEGAQGDDRPGHDGQQDDDQVIPERLLVLVAIGGKAAQVLVEEELAEEGGVLVLDGDEPGQDDGEVEQHARPPEGAADDGPLLAQGGKRADDDRGQERRHGALGQSGHAGEEVDVEEPELGVGLIPGVPAEQADGERRGHLHVGGRAAGEADDAGAGDGNEGGVEVAAGAESAHVQVNERHHDEGEGGRGQARAPVVDAELLKDEHGAPVVEGRLLQPGPAVEIGGNAGAQLALEGVGVVEAGEHFMGDLGIAGFVGADQAKAIAAQQGGDAIDDEENSE